MSFTTTSVAERALDMIDGGVDGGGVVVRRIGRFDGFKLFRDSARGDVPVTLSRIGVGAWVSTGVWGYHSRNATDRWDCDIFWNYGTEKIKELRLGYAYVASISSGLLDNSVGVDVAFWRPFPDYTEGSRVLSCQVLKELHTILASTSVPGFFVSENGSKTIV